MSIVIIVDSGACISKTMLSKCQINCYPSNIYFSNGDIYRDIIEIKNHNKLTELVKEHKEFPKILRPNSEELFNYLKKYIDKGEDVLYICVSSLLSDSYKEVCDIACKFPKGTIEVIDSLNIGSGETLLALYAREYIDKGYGLKQVAKYLNEIKYKIKSCYLMGNPFYLNNNQLKNFEYKKVDFSNHCPVLEVKDGRLILTLNAKISDIALQVLKNTIVDYQYRIDPRYFIIGYLDKKEEAKRLKTKVIKHVSDANVSIVEYNSLLFDVSGNNSLSLAFLVK